MTAAPETAAPAADKVAFDAFAKAQSEFPPIPFDKANPHFRSRYASLAAVLKATLPVLHKHGLALVTRTYAEADAVLMESSLVHEGRAFVRSTWPVGKASSTPQALGSALTYARRYTVQCVLGVVAEDDDDGNAASRPASAATPPNPGF